MIIFYEILLLIAAYILGSIPSALIISRWTKKVDIRNYGSKNMGATNVFRILGVKWAALVFLLDALKATIIIIFFKTGLIDVNILCNIHPLFYGVAATIGHLYPIFANFKGGKGVACTAGIILICSPFLFLVTAVSFIIVFLVTKYISLSSICAVIITFLTSLALLITDIEDDYVIVIYLGFVTIMTLYTHRKNIKRLVNRQENRLKHQEELLMENNELK